MALADFVETSHIDDIERQWSDFEMVKKYDITENVLRALSFDTTRRLEFIHQHAPFW